MKKSLSVLLCAVILQPLFAGSPTVSAVSAALPRKGKTEKKILLSPHPLANQETVDATGKQNDKGFDVREWDGSLYLEASMLYWDGDDRTVSLVLAIQYPAGDGTLPTPKPPELLFVPNTIVVILPNSHSYRPYNKADVLERAYALEKNLAASTYSASNPPPVSTYNTECSLSANAANCRTTADQSAQAGYAVGFALGATIKNAFARHKAEKYIKQIKEGYLVSQQIPLGATVIGQVDVYVEDVHGGPFTVRIPVGDKTYDFVFGPEVTTLEIPKEN